MPQVAFKDVAIGSFEIRHRRQLRQRCPGVPLRLEHVEQMNLGAVPACHAPGLRHHFAGGFRKIHAGDDATERLGMGCAYQHDFGAGFAQALGGQRAGPVSQQ